MDWQTLFAGIAACVALAALIRHHFDAEDRANWEAEQTTRRENFEKEQSRRQREWEQLHEEQRKQERAEDIARAAEEVTPKLRITMLHGYRTWGNSKILLYSVNVQNTGKVGVYVNTVLMRDPTGQSVHTIYQTTIDLDTWKDANMSTLELPALLQPTQSFEVHWVRGNFKRALRQDHSGIVSVRAIARDGAGTAYESDDFSIDLDEEP